MKRSRYNCMKKWMCWSVSVKETDMWDHSASVSETDGYRSAYVKEIYVSSVSAIKYIYRFLPVKETDVGLSYLGKKQMYKIYLLQNNGHRYVMWKK